MSETTGFEGWAVLEVMGHRKLGGFVRFDPPELPGMIRVDVFTDGDAPIATQYYGVSSLFCLTPTTEALARQLGKSCEIKPVARWKLPAPEPEPTRKPIPSPIRQVWDDEDEDDRDEDDDESEDPDS